MSACSPPATECVGKNAEDVDGSWGADAFDQVVEAWVTLLSDSNFPASMYGQHCSAVVGMVGP